MNDDKIIKIAATVFIVAIVVPIVINGTLAIVGYTYAVGANTINKMKYNKQMKKGLKNGSVIKFEGDYYTVGYNKED